jgi:hypothetical protein
MRTAPTFDCCGAAQENGHREGCRWLRRLSKNPRLAMKPVAWEVRVPGWPEVTSVVSAETRSRAIAQCLRSAKDAGFALRWVDFTARRRPDLDRLTFRYPTLLETVKRADAGLQ